MESIAGKRLPSWGAEEIEIMIERCTELEQLNTRKHDPIHPDLSKSLEEFRETLEDAHLELEAHDTKLWIGLEEFQTILLQVKDFLIKHQSSPRPEQGIFKRRRSSHSEDRAMVTANLKRLNDKLHSQTRKLKRYITLIKKQVEEANHNQILSLLAAPGSASAANIHRVQTAMSDYSAPAFHRQDTFDLKSILTSITLLKSSKSSDDGDNDMDREIRDELEQRTDNWLKRLNAPEYPPRPQTIISDFVDPEEEEQRKNEMELEDICTPLPHEGPNRTATGFHSVQTTPDSIFGSELFVDAGSSVVSLPRGVRLANIENCLVTFSMKKKRHEILCNVEIYRDGTSDTIRFVPVKKNASVLKYYFTESDIRPTPNWETDSQTAIKSGHKNPHRVLVQDTPLLNKNKAVQEISDIVYGFANLASCKSFQEYVFGRRILGYLQVHKLDTKREREFENGILTVWTTDRSVSDDRLSSSNCSLSFLSKFAKENQHLDIPVALFSPNLIKRGKIVRELKFHAEDWKNAMGFLKIEFFKEEDGRALRELLEKIWKPR